MTTDEMMDRVSWACDCRVFMHHTTEHHSECFIHKARAAYVQARNEALNEAATHLRSVADVIDSQGNVTSHTIARLYRAEADAILVLTAIAAGE